jgi:hypothetical protein
MIRKQKQKEVDSESELNVSGASQSSCGSTVSKIGKKQDLRKKDIYHRLHYEEIVDQGQSIRAGEYLLISVGAESRMVLHVTEVHFERGTVEGVHLADQTAKTGEINFYRREKEDQIFELDIKDIIGWLPPPEEIRISSRRRAYNFELN